MRRYILTGTLNTRDLGGYPTASGAYTKYGRLLRSDAPTELTSSDLDALYAMDIRAAVDLRGAGEISRRPSSFVSDSRFSYHHRHMDDRMHGGMPESDIAQNYFDMVHRGDTVRDAMGLIAAESAGLLINCAAGKDRTGVLAAMALDLAGVLKADIVADYQVTGTYIWERFEQMFREAPDIPRFLGQSKPEYIEGFFERLYGRYGSTEAFLLSRGVTEGEIARVRGKLLG